MNLSIDDIYQLHKVAIPIFEITGLTNENWFRNVKENDPRRGPWKKAIYTQRNKDIWSERKSCLYFVQKNRDKICYVGISRNRLQDRWRLSPALCTETLTKLPNQLFHNQCWPVIQQELTNNPALSFQVSVVQPKHVLSLLNEKGLSEEELTFLAKNEESLIQQLEYFIRSQKNTTTLPLWNKV